MKKKFWFLVFSLLVVAFLRSNFSYINQSLLAQWGGSPPSGISSGSDSIQNFTLTINKIGNGEGVVGSSPDGINCGGVCHFSFGAGTFINLNASANTGSSFQGWSGGSCSGTPPCFLNLNSDITINAQFNLNSGMRQYILTTNKTGSGGGTITSLPTGINCGFICQASFNNATSITLTATPLSGSTFIGWSGDCIGVSCVLTMTTNKKVIANFGASSSGDGEGSTGGGGDETQQYTLTINKIGNGEGVVGSSPDGINCGGVCHFSFGAGTFINLNASADDNSIFNGWFGGGCFGNSTCTTIINADKKIDAQFTLLGSTSTQPIFDNPPVIKYLTKNAAATNDENIESLQISAQGSGLFSGAILVLSLNDNYVLPSDNPDVFETHNDQDATIDSVITAVFNLKNQPAGLYNVTVFNYDGQFSVLSKAFNLVATPITPIFFREKILPSFEYLYSFFEAPTASEKKVDENREKIAQKNVFVTNELPIKKNKIKPRLLSRLNKGKINQLSETISPKIINRESKLKFIFESALEHISNFSIKAKGLLPNSLLRSK